jgi:hypothetical protein
VGVFTTVPVDRQESLCSAKNTGAYSCRSGGGFCESSSAAYLYALIRSTTVNTFFVSKELIVRSFDFFPWYSAHTV